MRPALPLTILVVAIGISGCCLPPPHVDAPLVSYEQPVDRECVEVSGAPGTGIEAFWAYNSNQSRRSRTVLVEVTPAPDNRCRIEVYMRRGTQQLLVSTVTAKARARATIPARENVVFDYYCVPLPEPPPDARCKGSILVSVY